MCLVAFTPLLWFQIAYGAYYDDLRGPYCETRPGRCCPGRDDQCSVPIKGTLCYCDEFCNRTRSDDCCPDFWNFCLNVDPPSEIYDPGKRCYHGGKDYNVGQEIKINCNKCKCDRVGQSDVEFLCERNNCLIDFDIVSGVNANRNLGWTASNYSMFWGKTLDDGITFRTGTLLPHRAVKKMMPVMKTVSRLPRSFDARNKWPGLVSGPFDQGWCGASWVISTVAVASDRYAIMSRGMEKVKLSAQHLLSCNNRGQRGCQGGHLSRAWMFVRKFGLVDDACYPWTGNQTTCRLPKKSTLTTARCAPLPSQHTLRTELYKVGPAYRLKSEEDIMDEIMESGPVQATMKVYQDFFSYKSGVYKKTGLEKSASFGYHSVRIVGWGEEPDIYGQPLKYWLAVNSWGPYWGEEGLFKILRGTNECEIEEFVLAAWAKTTDESLRGKFFPSNGKQYTNGNYINNTLYVRPYRNTRHRYY